MHCICVLTSFVANAGRSVPVAPTRRRVAFARAGGVMGQQRAFPALRGGGAVALACRRVATAPGLQGSSHFLPPTFLGPPSTPPGVVQLEYREASPFFSFRVPRMENAENVRRRRGRV